MENSTVRKNPHTYGKFVRQINYIINVENGKFRSELYLKIQLGVDGRDRGWVLSQSLFFF